MKKMILFTPLLAVLLCIGNSSRAQMQTKSEFSALAASPMEMAYFPSDYPMANVRGNASTLVARVIYCRPQKKGREIFGKLVPYGKVWRLGANEATELDIYTPVMIGGQQIPVGRYTLYAVPQTDKWTMVLSKQVDIWGAFGYKQSDDILRTDIPVEQLSQPLEAFSMTFEKTSGGANLVMGWDNVKTSLPIQVAGM
jgi:hypothetical protein